MAVDVTQPVARPARTLPALWSLPGAGWQVFKDAVKWPFYALYEYRMAQLAATWRKPQHIGVIMDGNRRFARQYGFTDISQGHEHGAQHLYDVLKWCRDFDIRVMTVWALSLDNFSRDPAELDKLLELFESKFREIVSHEEIHRYHVKVRYIGSFERLPASLQAAIDAAQTATAAYEDFVLNVAIAYGGREEITDAFRRYLEDEAKTGRSLAEVASALKPTAVDPYLYTSGLPDPDLIIRTSGEVRIGGFLLWQSVYSEFYFCDTYWPAFRRIDFLRALRSYDQRKRRFGK
ncbi:MAG TPA: polyprenyl diphosphate synthase [Candidatus Kryptonia bacterium]|nr:polyprenyl diphosphate synthase [Candidatus Kryptonia bacterium]